MSAKDVAKHGEDIIHGHASAETAERASVTGGATQSGMAELVVTGTLDRIAQHVIRFCRFLEFLFRCFVARVFVRMVLDGLFTISFLYFFYRCCLFNFQYFVVISFFHTVLCYSPTTTLA